MLIDNSSYPNIGAQSHATSTDCLALVQMISVANSKLIAWRNDSLGIDQAFLSAPSALICQLSRSYQSATSGKTETTG
jgi:hypothetical protein